MCLGWASSPHGDLVERPAATARSVWPARSFRLNKGRPGLDIVVMPRPGFSDAPFLTLEADYRTALQRYERSTLTVGPGSPAYPPR